MSAALIPWETCNIPTEIQLELKRRKTNRSFNYKKSDGWKSDGGDWEQYKGPMTSWVRICSNGMGRPEINKPGFVFSGGKGFYQSYGFKVNSDKNQQILGYTPGGTPHILEYDKNTSQFPIHVPPPEILKIETVIQKELYRRVWIHWKCFSPKQLEYMTPYFLVPKTTVIVEFGWNHFNETSLIDLTNEEKLAEYFFKNPYPLYNDNVLGSNGNYDVVYGIISNFEWSIEGNQINCMTEVTSLQRLYAGVPISTVVAEKQESTNGDPSKTKYYSDIRKLCDTHFIENLKAISQLESLDDADKKLASQQLFQLIKGGRKPGESQMKEEYWRGIFFGRDDLLMKRSEELDYKWTTPLRKDFDHTVSDVWVNMGFLVELLNRTFAVPSPDKESGFFEVDVDSSVIGAHPNHISNDGKLLLIPNSMAPKYLWGDEGKAANGAKGDYLTQFRGNRGKPISATKEKNDILWNANRQLTKLFRQDEIHRDDIDWVINANRYIFCPQIRGFYCFPFANQEFVSVKNRGDKMAEYDPYYYGYFKDLYFNVNRFIELVKDENIKTYVDLYRALFDDINKAGGNFWDLTLVPNDNTSKLIVVDNKMLPSGNNKSKPMYFDYLDTDSIMNSIAFKPKMSDAQTVRALFGESNNANTKTVIKEENDLLDYKFEDRILIKKKDLSPTVTASEEDKKDPFIEQIRKLQQCESLDECYQFTVMVEDKPFFRRLVLPDAEILNCLLDDNDTERNQRYTGIQPITVEISLQGIGGLRTFMTFLVRNLPNPYHHRDVCYRIVDVHHSLQDGKWDTTIKAGIIPLRGYIKTKLGIEE